MTKKELDNSITQVINNTKDRLFSLIKDVIKDEEKENELKEGTDLDSWFAFTTASLHQTNKDKTENSYKQMKDDYFKKLIKEIEEDIKTNDAAGTALILKRHGVFRKFSEEIAMDTTARDISNPINCYLSEDNDQQASLVLCMRCLPLKDEENNIMTDQQKTMFDTFEALIQKSLCSQCNWTLDPSLLEEASKRFETNLVSYGESKRNTNQT